jgi:tetratricopeptide (TPR) repeat protein
VGLAGAYRDAGALDRAQASIERALDAMPDDVNTQLEAGRVFQALAETSTTGRSANLARARRAYGEAARLDPDLAAALALDASSYLMEGEDPAEGLRLVTRAYRILPGSLEIQLLFARLEAARGKRAPARLHAADVASRGHDLDIEDEAVELIEATR